MLIRPKSRSVAISIRQFRDAWVFQVNAKEAVWFSQLVRSGGEVYREVRIEKDGEQKVLYEIVAEGDYEQAILENEPRYHRNLRGDRVEHVWRFPVARRGDGALDGGGVRDQLPAGSRPGEGD